MLFFVIFFQEWFSRSSHLLDNQERPLQRKDHENTKELLLSYLKVLKDDSDEVSTSQNAVNERLKTILKLMELSEEKISGEKDPLHCIPLIRTLSQTLGYEAALRKVIFLEEISSFMEEIRVAWKNMVERDFEILQVMKQGSDLLRKMETKLNIPSKFLHWLPKDITFPATLDLYMKEREGNSDEAICVVLAVEDYLAREFPFHAEDLTEVKAVMQRIVDDPKHPLHANACVVLNKFMKNGSGATSSAVLSKYLPNVETSTSKKFTSSLEGECFLSIKSEPEDKKHTENIVIDNNSETSTSKKLASSVEEDCFLSIKSEPEDKKHTGKIVIDNDNDSTLEVNVNNHVIAIGENSDEEVVEIVIDTDEEEDDNRNQIKTVEKWQVEDKVVSLWNECSSTVIHHKLLDQQEVPFHSDPSSAKPENQQKVRPTEGFLQKFAEKMDQCSLMIDNRKSAKNFLSIRKEKDNDDDDKKRGLQGHRNHPPAELACPVESCATVEKTLFELNRHCVEVHKVKVHACTICATVIAPGPDVLERLRTCERSHFPFDIVLNGRTGKIATDVHVCYNCFKNNRRNGNTLHYFTSKDLLLAHMQKCVSTKKFFATALHDEDCDTAEEKQQKSYAEVKEGLKTGEMVFCCKTCPTPLNFPTFSDKVEHFVKKHPSMVYRTYLPLTESAAKSKLLESFPSGYVKLETPKGKFKKAGKVGGRKRKQEKDDPEDSEKKSPKKIKQEKNIAAVATNSTHDKDFSPVTKNPSEKVNDTSRSNEVNNSPTESTTGTAMSDISENVVDCWYGEGKFYMLCPYCAENGDRIITSDPTIKGILFEKHLRKLHGKQVLSIWCKAGKLFNCIS